MQATFKIFEAKKKKKKAFSAHVIVHVSHDITKWAKCQKENFTTEQKSASFLVI